MPFVRCGSCSQALVDLGGLQALLTYTKSRACSRGLQKQKAKLVIAKLDRLSRNLLKGHNYQPLFHGQQGGIFGENRRSHPAEKTQHTSRTLGRSRNDPRPRRCRRGAGSQPCFHSVDNPSLLSDEALALAVGSAQGQARKGDSACSARRTVQRGTLMVLASLDRGT